MSDGSSLRVGMNVDIQRSDGRVHSACISGINPGTDSVTVEWFERGDTKGKEIEISAIFALNPNLAAPAEPPPPAPAPPAQSHIPAPKSRISSAKAAHPESNRPSAKPTPRETRETVSISKLQEAKFYFKPWTTSIPGTTVTQKC